MMKSSLHLRPYLRTACRQLSTTTKPIKLYGFPMSQPVRSVLLLCNSADIKYDFVLVNALKGEHLKPDFKKIHPAGLLPAIEEEGLGVMGECSAILVYLAETRKLEQWYPSDPIRRAHVNFFLSWHHGNTRLATSGLIRNKMFPPKGESLLILDSLSLILSETLFSLSSAYVNIYCWSLSSFRSFFIHCY